MPHPETYDKETTRLLAYYAARVHRFNRYATIVAVHVWKESKK